MGNIPLEWYEDYPHLGYDLDGKRIIKPVRRDEVRPAISLPCGVCMTSPPPPPQLDEYLSRMDDPNYWRSVRDRVTGREVVLTEQQLKAVQRIQQSHFPEDSYDQYEVSIRREEE